MGLLRLFFLFFIFSHPSLLFRKKDKSDIKTALLKSLSNHRWHIIVWINFDIVWKNSFWFFYFDFMLWDNKQFNDTEKNVLIFFVSFILNNIMIMMRWRMTKDWLLKFLRFVSSLLQTKATKNASSSSSANFFICIQEQNGLNHIGPVWARLLWVYMYEKISLRRG